MTKFPLSLVRISLAVSAVVLVGSVAVGAPTPRVEAAPPNLVGLPRQEANTARYIVRFAEGATDADISDLIDDAKRRGRSVRKGLGKAVRQVQLSKIFKGGVYDLSTDVVAELSARIGAGDARIAWVERDIDVRVEPQRVVGATATQSSAPWGLDRIDQGSLPLNSSYSYGTTGTGVTAYVVDTGILATHADFGGRVRTGFDSIGDGRNSSDCNGHGTHVAGTIGGSTYGVAKSVNLVAVRVLDCTGSGSLSGVVAGIDWVLEDHVSGPAVLNLSLGGGASSSLDAAVDRAITDNISVVVAAGNSNVDACTVSPARASNAITVGATTSTDARASYSNFGACLDLFAPGSSILSTYHTSNTATSTLSGTSMASPHVAGAAARLLETNATLRPDQISAALVAAATMNKVTGPGAGSPNRLLYMVPDSSPSTTSTTSTTAPSSGATSPTTAAPTTTTTSTVPLKPPPAPVDVRAVGGNQSAVVSWVDGASDNTLTHDHTIYVYRSGRLEKSVVVGDVGSATISELKANQSYTFRVSARNIVGPSDLSAPSNAVVPFSANMKRADTDAGSGTDTTVPSSKPVVGPDTEPATPSAVTAKLTGTKLVLRWSAKSVSETGTEFTVVIRSRGRIISRIPMGSVTELTLSGIRSTTQYSYRVIAENGTGVTRRSVIVRAER